MDISFAGFSLFSNDPQRLMHFFMSVFDVENESVCDEYLEFYIAKLSFRIYFKENLEHADFSLPCVFSVDNQNELKALSQKIEFFYYRDSKSFDMELNDSSLSFSDPDGRVWSFTSNELLYTKYKNKNTQVLSSLN